MTAAESDQPADQALALLHRLVTGLEADAPQQARMEKWGKTWGTPSAVVASAVTIVVRIVLTAIHLHNSSEQFDRTVRQSSEQFDRTSRQSQYSDIVAGLASSSVGVQVNSYSDQDVPLEGLPGQELHVTDCRLSSGGPAPPSTIAVHRSAGVTCQDHHPAKHLEGT